jgi:hydroxysqualene dehydroxylase
MTTVHVIGAGLAGLSAALSLTAKCRSVIIHEAGPAAGGRCRSYFDRELGLRIDNGNHLLLSGNHSAKAYIAEIGAWDEFHIPARAEFPFMDLKTHERWTLQLNNGRIPWWILQPRRRVPATRLREYGQLARITSIKDNRTVADSMPRGRLFHHLLEPLAVAALNTPAEDGLARLLAAVMRETLMQGGKACLPMLPIRGLSEAMIDPAIATLRARGAEIRFNSRIAAFEIEGDRIAALKGPDGLVKICPAEAVVLAVPPWVAADLLPGLVAPNAFQAILNIHFRHAADPSGPLRRGFIGLTSGTAEWLFAKPEHVSITISAANDRADYPAQTIATQVWTDVIDALGQEPCLKATMPAYRVVKEKRATFAATAEQEQRRSSARTPLASNLALAGDWTRTGLPATIEGAIRSGRSAAEVVLSF